MCPGVVATIDKKYTFVVTRSGVSPAGCGAHAMVTIRSYALCQCPIQNFFLCRESSVPLSHLFGGHQLAAWRVRGVIEDHIKGMQDAIHGRKMVGWLSQKK